jgi:ribosomal protein S18 acetylase RimI-like enzyme
MKEGQIINRLFIDQRGKMIEIVIRAPKKGDAYGVWRFYNRVIGETKFLSRITPVKLKDEKKWVEQNIFRMKKKNTVLLLAEHAGKIVGSCSMDRRSSETDKHVGHYGICVLQAYTGCGLGTKLTEHVLALARKEMKLEMAQLSVYSKNRIAISLYKKMGFRKAGKIPRGIKHGREYMDNVIMYKVLK